MSYRPYPSKKPISYGSRHHLMQAYKPPVVRGYGTRSPYQTGSGVGKDVGVSNGTGTSVNLNGGTYFVGVNVGSGLTTVSNNIATYPSRNYGSFELAVSGNSGAGQNLTITNKLANSFGLSASSNVINTENLAIYEINGWLQLQVNTASAGTRTGLVVCDSVTGIELLDCTISLPSAIPLNPGTYCVSGFFAANGPIVIKVYNGYFSATPPSYSREGDVSIKRIA